MKPTISVWSDRKYRPFVPCLQEQKPNAQWLGSGLSNRSHRIVPLGTLNVRNFHRRTGRGGGGEGGCVLCNSDFLGSERKFGQSQFLKTSPFYLIILKTWILTWSRRNNPVTLQWLPSMWWVIYIFAVFFGWALYCTALAGMGYFQSRID